MRMRSDLLFRLFVSYRRSLATSLYSHTGPGNCRLRIEYGRRIGTFALHVTTARRCTAGQARQFGLLQTIY
jgi:hypothetical protein